MFMISKIKHDTRFLAELPIMVFLENRRGETDWQMDRQKDIRRGDKVIKKVYYFRESF